MISSITEKHASAIEYLEAHYNYYGIIPLSLISGYSHAMESEG
jgi:hypothetical protein